MAAAKKQSFFFFFFFCVFCIVLDLDLDLDGVLLNAPGGVRQTGFVVRCLKKLVAVEVALKLSLECFGYGYIS